MAPPRDLTSDNYTNEKTPQSPVSPTKTDATLTEGAINEITGNERLAVGTSSLNYPIDVESAQPRKWSPNEAILKSTASASILKLLSRAL